MRNAIFSLAALALLLAGAGQSRAAIIQLNSPGDLSGSDTTAIYTGSDGDMISSPYSLAAGSNTLTFTATTGVQFQRVDQGTSWSGDFPDGTKLLWSLDPVANTASPMSIGFASGVSEVGLQVQQDHIADTTFTATAYSGSTPELTITVLLSGSGGLGFIGFKDTTGKLDHESSHLEQRFPGLLIRQRFRHGTCHLRNHEQRRHSRAFYPRRGGSFRARSTSLWPSTPQACDRVN